MIMGGWKSKYSGAKEEGYDLYRIPTIAAWYGLLSFRPGAQGLYDTSPACSSAWRNTGEEFPLQCSGMSTVMSSASLSTWRPVRSHFGGLSPNVNSFYPDDPRLAPSQAEDGGERQGDASSACAPQLAAWLPLVNVDADECVSTCQLSQRGEDS